MEPPIDKVLKRYKTKLSDVELITSANLTHICIGFSKENKNTYFETPVDITDSKYNIVEKNIYRYGVYLADKLALGFDQLIGNKVQIHYLKDEFILINTKDRCKKLTYKLNTGQLKSLSYDSFPVLEAKNVSFSDYDLTAFENFPEITVEDVSYFAKAYENRMGSKIITIRTTAEVAIMIKGGEYNFLIYPKGMAYVCIKLVINEDIPDVLSDEQLLRI